MFWAFMAIILATTLLMALMMVAMVRSERASALENELRMQARDVARLMQQYGSTSFWARDSSVSDILNWKFEEIRDGYNADVWLVTASRRVYLMGSNDYQPEQLNDETVILQIDKVLSGEEIRVQGLISELGPHMVTIGVPWLDYAGRVNGAVLLHISTDALVVDYSDMVRNVAVAAPVSIALGRFWHSSSPSARPSRCARFVWRSWIFPQASWIGASW